MCNEMIKDDRIEEDITIAIDVLKAIRYVHQRDGFVAKKYLKEKLDTAKSVINFLDSFLNELER